MGRRGFYLLKNGHCVFETKHKLGLLPQSSVNLHGEDIEIKLKNFVGDRCNIFKNGVIIGVLDFYHYLYSVISLLRTDGSTDIFKLEEEGYSQTFLLSNDNQSILKFKTSLNPFLIDDRFEIERLEHTYPIRMIEELIFYAGEILYRKIRPDSSPL